MRWSNGPTGPFFWLQFWPEKDDAYFRIDEPSWAGFFWLQFWPEKDDAYFRIDEPSWADDDQRVKAVENDRLLGAFLDAFLESVDEMKSSAEVTEEFKQVLKLYSGLEEDVNGYIHYCDFLEGIESAPGEAIGGQSGESISSVDGEPEPADPAFQASGIATLENEEPISKSLTRPGSS